MDVENFKLPENYDKIKSYLKADSKHVYHEKKHTFYFMNKEGFAVIDHENKDLISVDLNESVNKNLEKLTKELGN